MYDKMFQALDGNCERDLGKDEMLKMNGTQRSENLELQ